MEEEAIVQARHVDSACKVSNHPNCVVIVTTCEGRSNSSALIVPELVEQGNKTRYARDG